MIFLDVLLRNRQGAGPRATASVRRLAVRYLKLPSQLNIGATSNHRYTRYSKIPAPRAPGGGVVRFLSQESLDVQESPFLIQPRRDLGNSICFIFDLLFSYSKSMNKALHLAASTL